MMQCYDYDYDMLKAVLYVLEWERWNSLSHVLVLMIEGHCIIAVLNNSPVS